MWIKQTTETTTRLFNDDYMEEPVEFNDNFTANVPEDVGEEMVERYDNIEYYEKEGED